MGGVTPPNIFRVARRLVESQSCCKRVGYSISRDILLATIVGQIVKTSPQRKVPQHTTSFFLIIKVPLPLMMFSKHASCFHVLLFPRQANRMS